MSRDCLKKEEWRAINANVIREAYLHTDKVGGKWWRAFIQKCNSIVLCTDDPYRNGPSETMWQLHDNSISNSMILYNILNTSLRKNLIQLYQYCKDKLVLKPIDLSVPIRSILMIQFQINWWVILKRSQR